MTLKDFIATYNGATFKRTVIKGATIADIPAMRAELEEACKAQGLRLVENVGTWDVYDGEHATGQKFLKPRVERELVGTLEFKSNRTIFDGGVGELPKASELDGLSFTKDYGNIAYKYEVVEA